MAEATKKSAVSTENNDVQHRSVPITKTGRWFLRIRISKMRKPVQLKIKIQRTRMRKGRMSPAKVVEAATNNSVVHTDND